MNVYCLLKSSYKSTLIAIIMALLVSACSSESSATPDHSNANETGIINSDKDTKTNQPALINGTDTGSVTEDNDPNGNNLLETAGTLNITDSDAGEAAFIAKTHLGNFGYLDINTAGNWNYAAANNQSVIQSLTSSDALKDTLTVSSIDGTTHAVTITINGQDEAVPPPPVDTNQPAVISGADRGSVTEDNDPDGDNELETQGKLNITDSDTNEAAFTAATISSSFSRFTIDEQGYWKYDAHNDLSVIQNLNSGNTITDTLNVSSVDGTSHTVVITIIGVDEDSTNTNQPAIISGTDRGSVTEDNDPDGDNLLETAGTLSITDSDTGEATFVAKTHTGSYGKLVIDATGNWSYAADNNQSSIQNLTSSDTLKDTLTVSSIDGTTHNVVITILGTNEDNQPAVISGTDRGSVTEDNDPDGDNLLETAGTLSITDSDTGEATFVAKTHTGSYGKLVIDATGNWSYAADNNQSSIQNLTSSDTLKDTLTVSSIDGTTHNIVITVLGVDEASSTTADITLSWVAPSEREDNQPISLSDIAGYKIYYGTTRGNYDKSIDVNNSTAQSYTITNLPTGTYYLVITTKDTENRESQYSSEVIIVI